MFLPQANTIFDLKKLFQDALNDLYPKKEIQSIFRILLEDEFEVMPLDQLLNERRFTESELNRVDAALNRLVDGEPLQYVLGQTEFYGLKFNVNEAVLIPRPETEELVKMVIDENLENDLSFLDVGTGSGCIPISIHANRASWNVQAIDVSDAALVVAKESNSLNKTNVHFKLNDLFSEETVFQDLDIIVCNPPYIGKEEASEIHKNVLVFEPHLALFPENPDPLIFYKVLSEKAAVWLKPEGKLYFELNEKYANLVSEVMQKNGFQNIEIVQDMQGKDRFAKGVLKK
ncbi:MAG: release factor glutamine methyltransferase [Granulosicoccus sp.]|jgi:release factor glutamine methyltransferase